MTSDILPVKPDHLLLPQADLDLLQEIRRASIAPETRRAVLKNWSGFARWCEAHGTAALPCGATTMEAYLVHLVARGLKSASIDQARYSIDARHRWAGMPVPGESELVRNTMAGIRRKLRTRQDRKQALTIDHLRRLQFSETLSGLRDKAILLVGFAGGFRRSELAALRCEDIEEVAGGIVITLAHSKSDQEGRGEAVSIVEAERYIEWCPVESLRRWLHAADITSGAVFRSIRKNGRIGVSLSAKSIYLTVKKAAQDCGCDPAQFGGHSLRAGCATYLLDRGVPLNVVSRHLRHKRLDTTLKYDRNATAKALRGIY